MPDGYLYGEGFPRDTDGARPPTGGGCSGTRCSTTSSQRALENNRDVAVAASRVEEARQNLGVVRAQFLPQVGIGVTAEGEYTPQTKIVQTVCRRTVALVGDRPVRAAAQRQTGGQGADRLLGMGAAGRAAVAGRGGRHDLLHAARIRTRPGDRPAQLHPAARIGRTDRLDVPLRHVGRRGAGAGTQPGLYGRGGHPAIRARREADAAVARHPAGRNAAGGGQHGLGAAPARQTAIPPTSP